MTERLYLSDEDLSLFAEVLASFNEILDFDEMLATIFRKMKPFFDIEGASIALHDQVNREFYFYRSIEDMDVTGNQDNSPLRFPDNRGVAGWVKEHDRAVIINDVQADGRVYNIQGIDSDFLTRSMICVPLKTRKGFFGVFYALNKKSGGFIERDRKLLEIVSGTIAVSLENGRLYGELKDHLHTLEQERHLLLSQAREKAGFGEIIGSSPPMRRMFALMDKVIAIPTTVLIRGETGTGKELIARVIHYNGPLKEKSFIAENCAALPENLLESELFGYIKGAFTGAVSDKKGLFEIADGGTIFLDEIGEMSLPMQVKLLRVLQEGQFRPVGGQHTRQVNVRLIASTNRNLTEEISRGTFREDLYYRINVFEIIAPPLRERRDDIVHLANHFLEKFAQKYHKPVPRISPQTMDLLTRYNWPGNVRELENEMERAVTMAAGRTFIFPDLLSDKISPRGATDSTSTSEHAAGTLKEAVHHLEKTMIYEALENARGNRSLAAKMLGLSRQGLLNKIAAYGVNLK